jgi:NAD(P)-dependent dehydrogenase (short-subunit alcohol dehydrogenase family)
MGASSGIGLGIARKMAEEGAAVGINYRSHQEPAEKLAAEIRAWVVSFRILLGVCGNRESRWPLDSVCSEEPATGEIGVR